MPLALLVLTLVLAVVDWVVVWRCWQRADYFLKPAVLLALIAWFWSATRVSTPTAAWFAAGLIFSLLGDVFLLFPDKLFLAGLLAFLAAHLAYVAGFNPALPAPSWGMLPILAVILVAALWLARRVLGGLARRKAGPVLRYGVIVYSLALTLMTLSAGLTLVRPEWAPGPALLAAAGGLLFFASDSTLALNRFVSPLPYAELIVRITYHLGQLGLMLGIASHLLAA